MLVKIQDAIKMIIEIQEPIKIQEDIKMILKVLIEKQKKVYMAMLLFSQNRNRQIEADFVYFAFFTKALLINKRGEKPAFDSSSNPA